MDWPRSFSTLSFSPQLSSRKLFKSRNSGSETKGAFACSSSGASSASKARTRIGERYVGFVLNLAKFTASQSGRHWAWGSWSISRSDYGRSVSRCAKMPEAAHRNIGICCACWGCRAVSSTYFKVVAPSLPLEPRKD